MSILSIGLERGMEQGMQKGMANSIFMLLEELGTPSENLRKAIYSQKDQEVLARWLKAAAKADSLQEFERLIGI